jgi:hypothetical protein
MRFWHLINRSFVCKGKGGRHTRIINNIFLAKAKTEI